MGTFEDTFVKSFTVEEDGCWLWHGWMRPDGWGQLTGPNGKTVGAHRAAWMIAVGPIPEGLAIDHLCNVRACVNPDHMELVTKGENTRRARGWAWQERKTHCPQGHEYTPENTMIDDGRRKCRTCLRARSRANYWRRKLGF